MNIKQKMNSSNTKNCEQFCLNSTLSTLDWSNKQRCNCLFLNGAFASKIWLVEIQLTTTPNMEKSNV